MHSPHHHPPLTRFLTRYISLESLQVFFLLLMCVLIAYMTYLPGTWLTGWDTIHPEMDFGLAFKRLWYGVWRYEQGLGALAGHTHMADLPRVIILYLLSFVFPLSSLRYLYIFACLPIGVIGMWRLLRLRVWGLKHVDIVSLIGAVAYLCSLSTVQQFYVPFEMFPVQYAALPWVLMLTVRYMSGVSENARMDPPPTSGKLMHRDDSQLELMRNSRNSLHGSPVGAGDDHSGKVLFWFALVTLLSTPQAYAAHLWYPFFGCWVLMLGVYVVMRRAAWRRAGVLIFVCLSVNSFWLLPNIYYIVTKSDVPKYAKQNRLYSQEYRLRNRETGYIPDVAIQKGFYMNWDAYDFTKAQSTKLMPEWIAHFERIEVRAIGYVLFALALLGLISAYIRRHVAFIALSPLYLVPLILLLNHTPPFEQVFNVLLKIGLLDEALRFVFTKVSILFLCASTVYVAYGCDLIITRWTRRSAWKESAVLALSIAMLCWYCFPLFSGHLISPVVQVAIPQRYFDLWKVMNAQPDGTVLSLPLHSLSGWSYYDWGYQGSGFLWFGMKQPLLDRDFDRWETANEQAFIEIQYALYTKQHYVLDQVLDKYNVRYLLHDSSVIVPSKKDPSRILYRAEIVQILGELEQFGYVRPLYADGTVTVYGRVGKIHPAQLMRDPYTLLTNAVLNRYDYAYQNQGNYVSIDSTVEFVDPYASRSLINRTDRLDTTRVALDNTKNVLRIDGVTTPFDATKSALFTPATMGVHVRDTAHVWQDATHTVFESLQETVNLTLPLSGISTDESYLLAIQSKHVSGLPLRICLRRVLSDACSFVDELSRNVADEWDYFLIPNYQEAGAYQLSVENISYGYYPSKNMLTYVAMIHLPRDPLAVAKQQVINLGKSINLQLAQNTPHQMDISIPSSEIEIDAYLSIAQSYNPGWLAYDLTGANWLQRQMPVLFAGSRRLTDHVLVNNWANGWRLGERSNEETRNKETGNREIVVIFWPQYLQHLGFGVLLVTMGVLIWPCVWREKRSL